MTSITYTAPDWAHVVTDDPRLIHDLNELSADRPDECVILTEGRENLMRAKVPPQWIGFLAPRRMRSSAGADIYTASNELLKQLHRCKKLTQQQKLTMRGQALHGDVEGAWRGFKRLIENE